MYCPELMPVERANTDSCEGKGLGSLGSGVVGGLTGKGGKKAEPEGDEEESDSDRQQNSGFFG